MSQVSMPVQPPNQQFVQGVQDAPVTPDAQQVPQNVPVYGQPIPPVTPAPQGPPPGYFTAEQVEQIRQQEKDKLYGKINTVEQQLAALTAQKAEELAAAQAQQQAEAAAQREAAEADMSAKDLFAQREVEWNERLARMEREREQERLLFAKDQEFTRLQQYISRRSQEEAENIAPELLDFIDGNSPEEVEARIVVLRTKTDAIATNMSQAQIQARAQQRGVSTAGYASAGGPLDDQSQQKTFSADELAAMPMSEYAKIRGSLLGANASSPRGMFG